MRVRAAAACPQMPLLELSSAIMQAGARSQIEHAMQPACSRWMMGRQTEICHVGSNLVSNQTAKSGKTVANHHPNALNDVIWYYCGIFLVQCRLARMNAAQRCSVCAAHSSSCNVCLTLWCSGHHKVRCEERAVHQINQAAAISYVSCFAAYMHWS